MEEIEAFIALNMLDRIGSVTILKLLKEFGSAKEILQSRPRPASLFPECQEIQASTRSRGYESLLAWEKRIDLKAEMDRIRQANVHIVTIRDDHYPSFLKEIHDPPIVLYVRGDHQILNQRAVSLVGSRKTSDYGRETASQIAASVAATGVHVVSGGASGVDTFAHWGAIQASGRTVAVLGHGFNFSYPAENRRLFDRISAESGALITQFPFQRRGDRLTFPMRNRIVAGMTMGTIVVEAHPFSGAMITARMAADCNRHVFAVPGRFGDPFSAGCNQLIREGAILLDSFQPLIDELENLFPRMPPPAPVSKAPDGASSARFVPPPNLSPDQIFICSKMQDRPLQLDEIVRQTGLPIPLIQASLLQLEMMGCIQSHPGKVFSVKNAGNS